MAFHLDFGKKGEDIAAAFLEGKGYRILHRNWKAGGREVDLIARDGEFLVFAEVKTRQANTAIYPESAVDEIKQRHITGAAEYFMEQYTDLFFDIRFDIIAITFHTDTDYKLLHFDDAF